MAYYIEQAKNIIIKKEESPFLWVKRKYGFNVISQFFKGDKMLLETSLITYFLRQNVEVRFQDLPDKIALVQSRYFGYSLLVNNLELDMKIKYFRRPAFRLYQNGDEVGWIGNPKLVTLDGRYYKMQTEVQNDATDLYFLLLFVAQLRGF